MQISNTNMPEIKKLIDKKPVSYTGIFRADELYGIIRRFLGQRRYYLFETQNQEYVLEGGKELYFEMLGAKQFNEYAKGELELKIHIKKLKDKVVKIEGRDQKYQHGDLNIKFTAQMRTDYRTKYEGTGWHFLFRTISDKFIRRGISKEQEDDTVQNCMELISEIKSYLNMHRFKTDTGRVQRHLPKLDPLATSVPKEKEEKEETEEKVEKPPEKPVVNAEKILMLSAIVKHKDEVLLLQQPTSDDELECVSGTIEDPAKLREHVLSLLRETAGIADDAVQKVTPGEIIEIESDDAIREVYPVLADLSKKTFFETSEGCEIALGSSERTTQTRAF